MSVQNELTKQNYVPNCNNSTEKKHPQFRILLWNNSNKINFVLA